METGRSPASLAGSPSLSSGFTLDTGALVDREGALEKNVARDRTLPLLRVGWRVPPHVPAIQEVVRLCRLRPYCDAWVSLFEVPLLPVPQVEPHCEPPVARTSRPGPNLVTYLRSLVRQYSVRRGCDGDSQVPRDTAGRSRGTLLPGTRRDGPPWSFLKGRAAGVFANDPYWSIVVDHWVVDHGKWFEIAQKMAQAARAGLAFERQQLKEILASGNENTFLRQASRPVEPSNDYVCCRSEWLWQDQL